jgi:uncharacterized repeat protein (TIGR01451 family)
MRRVLWILSAPVVAGGLAWAVNAADEQSSLTRPQSGQSGKVFYFSRSGKARTDSAARAAISADEDSSGESLLAEAAPAPYVRNRTAAQTAAARGTKNFYKDLFGDPALEQSPAAAKRTAPLTPFAAPRTPRRPVLDEAVEEMPSDPTDAAIHEENPLPPVDESVELIQGTAEKADVRNADYKVNADNARRYVKQVQHSTKGTTKSFRGLDDLDVVAEPVSDLDDEPAPPPKTSRAPAAKTVTRPTTSAATRPATRSAPPAAAAAAAKARVTTKAAAADDAARSPAPQVTAVASDASEVPQITLKWLKLGEVNVGQECKCGLLVKNSGRLAVKDIVVEAYFPKTVKLLDADPFPSDSRDHLTWVLDSLDGGAEKTIEVTMMPSRRGDLATRATVRFTGTASALLKVEEPQLNIAVAGAREVVIGESTTQIITVSNPGTGVAHDVVVQAHIPAGLEHPRGKSVEMEIGYLGAGESREIKLPLTATGGGDAIIRVEARGNNLVQKAQSQIKVAAPKLRVEIAGPILRFINRPAQYTITVTNEGVAATDNVRVAHIVPEGFEFVRADRGKYETDTRTVTWFVGRLEGGQSRQVVADLTAKRQGDHHHVVQATGDNGSIAAARLDTKVDGASTLVMEVADLDDPVEIETQTAYEVCIRNEGSKAAQNLRLACELPQGVELIGTDGPTQHSIEKGLVTFRPLGELAAGGKTTFRLKVSGKVEGNLRLRAKLTANSAPEPLVVEELTRFYRD